MVNPLYWVSDIVYALVLLIISKNDIRKGSEQKKEDRAYTLLLSWVIFFCVQDTFWGLCGGELVKSDRLFFAASTIFHLSTVSTTFFWLSYVLTYLSDRVKHPKLFLLIDGIVVFFQVMLVVWNFFYPVIFRIENGIYVTCFLRPLAFFNQYVTYLIISILMIVNLVTTDAGKKSRYFSVFMFSLAPVFSGVFQLLYPDGPFYSMGYFLGCFIIHIFVVTRDRNELIHIQSERELAVQSLLARTDGLTGLDNRKSYEDDMRSYSAIPKENNFAYIAIDVNGLKQVNDNLGHAAGDELLRGTGECLRRCLGGYGKVYRIGGDEFAAIVFADSEKLDFLRRDLADAAGSWRGKSIDGISLAVGIATKAEFNNMTTAALAKMADERMYKDKAEYYKSLGIDRQGQLSAFAALCDSYTKILRINLTKDSYGIIRMDNSEMTTEKGFADSISAWLHDFGTSGQVHPEDLDSYLAQTKLDYLRAVFASGSQNLNIFYRRKNGSGYRMTKMELLPAEDYAPGNQTLYLYVKDIDK